MTHDQTTAEPARLDCFGPAPLFEGEDAAGYDELLARVSGAIKPADIIEEIWIRDIVGLTWERCGCAARGWRCWRRTVTSAFGACWNRCAARRRTTFRTNGRGEQAKPLRRSIVISPRRA